MKNLFYSTGYYEGISNASKRSAEAMLPKVFEIVQPKSWIEIGSGTGSWTQTAMELGVPDCVAVDGPWVKDSELLIPRQNFIKHDLTQPLKLNRNFDVALSLEVAEHLEERFAETIVGTLTSHADVIVFGAAIPMQGGTHHINEQWPSYWISKFADQGYECIDYIRPSMWRDERVAPFYIQNTFLFLKVGSQPELASKLRAAVSQMFSESHKLPFIHPRQYLGIATMEAISARLMLRQGPKVLATRVLGRLGVRI
ncbi:methyltransferase domain-containing protein [Bradyrhizobium yuanmingense]|uniref:methyltransferase domain-containing protein n=1 Tax=Bradyrhizobium yuanmingense TaxID=108015 RepID=UPI0006868558|nr:methyltransferase domain-containing protein [Bradyrhizobium yuanmingense]